MLPLADSQKKKEFSVEVDDRRYNAASGIAKYHPQLQGRTRTSHTISLHTAVLEGGRIEFCTRKAPVNEHFRDCYYCGLFTFIFVHCYLFCVLFVLVMFVIICPGKSSCPSGTIK